MVKFHKRQGFLHWATISFSRRVLLHAAIPQQSEVQIQFLRIRWNRTPSSPIRHTGIVLWISFFFLPSAYPVSIYPLFSPRPTAPNLRLISFISMSFLSTSLHTPKLYHVSFHFYSSLRTNLLTLLILYIGSGIPYLFRGRGKQETKCVWQFQKITSLL